MIMCSKECHITQSLQRKGALRSPLKSQRGRTAWTTESFSAGVGVRWERSIMRFRWRQVSFRKAVAG
jgi:hypothetical protein